MISTVGIDQSKLLDMRRAHFLVFSLTSCVVLLTVRGDENLPKKSYLKDKKVLSVFNIVRFRNEACNSSANRNGTCYTPEECTNRNGEESGSCAEGFGVCCIFDVGCGQTRSENNTYFSVTGRAGGTTCSAKICPCNDNICQVRLDFLSFGIAGPVTATADGLGESKILNGQASAMGESVYWNTRCLTDTFTVAGATRGGSPPVICGENTGQHVYVPMRDGCIDLNFALGTAGLANVASPSQKAWNIQVTQYDCNYNNLAPEGCTQYYFGEEMGMIQTFNYDGGAHLANQRQKICFRRERSSCRVCFSAAAADDVQVSSKADMPMTKTCCGYGPDGKKVAQYDCIRIPHAEKKDGEHLVGSQFCASKNGLPTGEDANTMKEMTICTHRSPFELDFISDNWEAKEMEGEAMKIQKGFKLNYNLVPCTG